MRKLPACMVAPVLALAVVLSAAPLARADDQADPAPEGYRELLVQALGHVNLREWSEAMALFERAHAMYPNARTLRGLTIVTFASRRYVDTISYGKAALANQVKPLTGKQQKELEELIEKAQTFVGHFEVSSSPEAVELIVNGQPALMDDGLLLLDPGKCEIIARAQGHEDLARQVSVRAGQRGRLRFGLKPLQSAPVAVVPGPDGATQEAPAPVHRGRRLWTWVAGGVALAAGGVAIGTLVSGNRESDSIAEECADMPAGKCTEEQAAALLDDSGIATKEAVTTAALIVSVTAAATAGFLFWFEARPDAQQPKVALGVSPGGLLFAGRF